MMIQDCYAYTGGKDFNLAQPTVVFIHGAQHDHSVWILQTRWFANHGYNVLAFDLPGHGKSGGKALASVELMAQALHDALAALGVAKAHLIGHSMGSLIALHMTGMAPEKVQSLALLGTAYPMKVSDALLQATQTDVQAAIDMINVWSHSGAFGGFSHKPQAPGPGFMHIWCNRRLMQRIAAKNGAGILHTDFAACNAYAGGEAAAKRVNCPVLIMNGKDDAMTPPKAAEALAASLADCKVVTLAKCGHALAAEQPDAVLKTLADHVRSAA
jgi:pimeloyl-ACP methyl ester carboxylesterase